MFSLGESDTVFTPLSVSLCKATSPSPIFFLDSSCSSLISDSSVCLPLMVPPSAQRSATTDSRKNLILWLRSFL